MTKRLALVLLLVSACAVSAPDIDPVANLAGSDAGVVTTGADAGPMPGSDAGSMPGSDAGSAPGSDAGSAQLYYAESTGTSGACVPTTDPGGLTATQCSEALGEDQYLAGLDYSDLPCEQRTEEICEELDGSSLACAWTGTACADAPPDPDPVTTPSSCAHYVPPAVVGTNDKLVEYCDDADLGFCNVTPDAVVDTCGLTPTGISLSTLSADAPTPRDAMVESDPLGGAGSGRTLDVHTAEVKQTSAKVSLGFKVSASDIKPGMPDVGIGVTVKGYDVQVQIEEGLYVTLEGSGTNPEFIQRNGPFASWVLDPRTTVTIKKYAKLAKTTGKLGNTEIRFGVIDASRQDSQVVDVTATLIMRKAMGADPDKWAAQEFCPPNKPGCPVTFADVITAGKAFFGRADNVKAFAERRDTAIRAGVAALLQQDGTGGGCFPMIVSVPKPGGEPEIDLACGMIQCSYSMLKYSGDSPFSSTYYTDKTALFAPAVDNQHTQYLVMQYIGNGSVNDTKYAFWAQFNTVDTKCTEVMERAGTYVAVDSIAFFSRWNNFLHTGTKADGRFNDYYTVQRKDKTGLGKGSWQWVGKYEHNSLTDFQLTGKN